LGVVKVAPVVLVLVLVGWGIKALVDRQEAMEAAEIVALTAVLVTRVGAVFTVAANAWLRRKRLASEERRHTERLAHERREAVRTTAAVAYGKVGEVLHHVNLNTIHRIAAETDFHSPEEITQTATEAQRSLNLVRALGRSKDVQDRALVLSVELLSFVNETFAVANVIRSNPQNEGEALKKYEAKPPSSTIHLR
jgi:hypothetical protein